MNYLEEEAISKKKRRPDLASEIDEQLEDFAESKKAISDDLAANPEPVFSGSMAALKETLPEDMRNRLEALSKRGQPKPKPKPA